MSIILIRTVILTLLITSVNPIFGQKNSYDLGVKAYQDKHYKFALEYLGKAITEDKYDISGKELAIAHTYLAKMQTGILELNLMTYQIDKITNNAGLIQSTVAQVCEALNFQSSNPKAEVLKITTNNLKKITTKAAVTLAESLVQTNNQLSTKATLEISQFIINEFGQMETINTDDLELYNSLGIAYYYLNKKDKAMIRFDKARLLYTQTEEKPISKLHIANYELTSQYLFESQKDLKTLDEILSEAIDYTGTVMTEQTDIEMNEITKLAKKQNRFQRMKSEARAIR